MASPPVVLPPPFQKLYDNFVSNVELRKSVSQAKMHSLVDSNLDGICAGFLEDFKVFLYRLSEIKIEKPQNGSKASNVFLASKHLGAIPQILQFYARKRAAAANSLSLNASADKAAHSSALPGDVGQLSNSAESSSAPTHHDHLSFPPELEFALSKMFSSETRDLVTSALADAITTSSAPQMNVPNEIMVVDKCHEEEMMHNAQKNGDAASTGAFAQSYSEPSITTTPTLDNAQLMDNSQPMDNAQPVDNPQPMDNSTQLLDNVQNCAANEKKNALLSIDAGGGGDSLALHATTSSGSIGVMDNAEQMRINTIINNTINSTINGIKLANVQPKEEQLSDSGSSAKEITKNQQMNIVERLRKNLAKIGATDEPKVVNNAVSNAQNNESVDSGGGGININATTTTEPTIMSRTAVYRMLREQLQQQKQKDTFKPELDSPELGNAGPNDVVQNNSGLDHPVLNNPELGKSACITAQNPVVIKEEPEEETVAVEVAIPVGSLSPIPPMSPSVSQEGIVEQEASPIPNEPSNPVNDQPSSPAVLPVPSVPVPTTPVLDPGLYLTTAYFTRSALKPSKLEYLEKQVEKAVEPQSKVPKLINKKMKVSSKKDNNRNKNYRNVGFVPTQLGTWVPRDLSAPYSTAGTSSGLSQSVVVFQPTFKNKQQSMKGQSGMVKKEVVPVMRATPVRGSHSSSKIILKAIRCVFCKKKKDSYLPSRPELVRHLKQIHKLEAFQCPLVECGQRFGGKIFSNHIRWQHKEVSSWPCGQCPAEARSVFARCAQLADHIRFVHEEGKFACGMLYCPFMGTNEQMVEQHFDLVHGDGYGDDDGALIPGDDALVPADVPMDEPMQYQQMSEPMIEQDEEKMDYEPMVNQNEDQEPKAKEVVVIKKEPVQENVGDLFQSKCPWDGCEFRSYYSRTMAYHIQVGHLGFTVKEEVGDEQTVQLNNAEQSMNEPAKKPEEVMIKDEVMDESDSQTVQQAA